jgi:uncharacterized protein (DUF58 family)
LNSTTARAESLAAGLPKLLLAAERLSRFVASGPHGRRRAGPGESFWQFRDWRDGDDAGRIDWRRSASGDVLLLREREWEAQAGVALRLHDTPGMEFCSERGGTSKRARAILVLLALASLLLRAGERVSLYGATPPLSGRAALHGLAAALANGASAAADDQSRRVEFGDFLSAAPLFAAPPGGAVMQILDPAECDFPYSGRVMFEGFAAEPGIEAPRAESWGEAYRSRISAQRELVAAAAARAGQTALFHRTDAAPATALAALYLALRRQ